MLAMRQLVMDLMYGFVNTMKTVMMFPLTDKRNIKLYARRTTIWCVVDGGAKVALDESFVLDRFI